MGVSLDLAALPSVALAECPERNHPLVELLSSVQSGFSSLWSGPATKPSTTSKYSS